MKVNFVDFFYSFTQVFLIALVMYCTFQGFLGVSNGQHNIDLSYNMLKISYDKNLTLYNEYKDYANDGNTYTYGYLYYYGFQQVSEGRKFFSYASGLMILFYVVVEMERRNLGGKQNEVKRKRAKNSG